MTGISHCLQSLAAENYLDLGHSPGHGHGYGDTAAPMAPLRADGKRWVGDCKGAWQQRLYFEWIQPAAGRSKLLRGSSGGPAEGVRKQERGCIPPGRVVRKGMDHKQIVRKGLCKILRTDHAHADRCDGLWQLVRGNAPWNEGN